LSGKISLYENFEDVTAVFFLRDRVHPRFERVKGPKIVIDPLSNPICSLRVKGTSEFWRSKISIQ
jgi:hypothetical protein